MTTRLNRAYTLRKTVADNNSEALKEILEGFTTVTQGDRKNYSVRTETGFTTTYTDVESDEDTDTDEDTEDTEE